MKVHLLTIEHRHGADHFVCATPEVADKLLDDYVCQWWPEEMKGAKMPKKPATRIERYFDAMGERDGDAEFYSIEEHPVLEDLPVAIVAVRREGAK